MEKLEAESEEVHTINDELATIFRLLSNHDAVKILYRAGQGIRNSTYAMEELNLTPKRYYYRLKELMAADLVKKVDDAYRQTALGRIMYDHFLPAMGKTVDAKDKLELLIRVEGTEMEPEIRRIIEAELNIPIFTDSTNMKVLGDYEALVCAVLDMCDSAEESILLASNYFDVRVMESTFRSMNRGVTNRLILGKRTLSSRLQQLRMMLSPAFTMAIIKNASDAVKLGELAKIVDVPYSFCVVDGHRIIVEFSDALNDSFILALSFDDRDVGEKLTKFYEKLWEAGNVDTAIESLNSLKPS